MANYHIGEVFYRLTITSSADPFISNSGKTYAVEVACDCGKIKIVRLKDVLGGKIKSCGCLSRETTIKRNANGFLCPAYYDKKLFAKLRQCYLDINRRCKDANNDWYPEYGGRGIQNLWDTFKDFFMDVGQEFASGLTIDRLDVDGNYCKENCRWTTVSVQNHNKRGYGKYSKFIGVCWDKNRRRWKSSICQNGVKKNIARFLSEIDAAKAYDNESFLLYGDRPNKT